MSKIDQLKLEWRHATGMGEAEAVVFEGRLARLLTGWEGTPYMAGQQCKGAGVDCVRFVCAILDELFQLPPVPIQTLPADASLHYRGGAIAGMKKIHDLYAPVITVEDGSLEPGDVIITGPKDGGPGHAMIVGSRKNEIWHAAWPNVHRTGLGLLEGAQEIFRVYRKRELIGGAA